MASLKLMMASSATENSKLLNSVRENFSSDTVMVDTTVGAVDAIKSGERTDPESSRPPSRKELGDVFGKIEAGKRRQQQWLENKMMTLDDFLARQWAMEENVVEVEEREIERFYAFDNSPVGMVLQVGVHFRVPSQVVGMGVPVGMDVGARLGGPSLVVEIGVWVGMDVGGPPPVVGMGIPIGMDVRRPSLVVGIRVHVGVDVGGP
ncbi:G-box-binding factor 4-like [Abeliophyllum distichum]|uniref:G-box-binding factor 4-like n=1 Tax=Abeliophyllum distichum TaxID=126358 RepID=A0ABD1S9M6_9LAMI